MFDFALRMNVACDAAIPLERSKLESVPAVFRGDAAKRCAPIDAPPDPADLYSL